MAADEERQRLIALGRGRRADHEALPAVTLIQRAVETWPDRIAVECAGTTLTFAQMWQQAGEVAGQLSARGVRRGAPVGVAMGRGPSLIPALLGIWRAGCCYVPLDPRSPKHRRELILAEVSQHGLRYVLTGEASGALPSIVTVPSAGAGTPIPASRPDLAYIMFTSGSTGRPKGTTVTQDNVGAFLRALEDVFVPAADEVTLATTALSFDISVLEIFWPLAYGRRVVLLETITDSAVGSLAAVLTDGRPKLIQLTPSTARLVALPDRLPKTRVLLGGEALPRPLAAMLAQRCDRLYNMYGPTETTVWVTWHEVRDGPEDVIVRLGRPLPNCDVLLVDADGDLAPVGQAGELYIGGPQVAPGYLTVPANQPNPFLPDFGGIPGPWYRTGDHCRWSPDGTLTFIGRRDDQVKIAGNRVELGEIEAVLREHERVTEAVVVYPPRDIEPQLHAFLTVRPPSDAARRRTARQLVDDWARVFEQQLSEQTRAGAPGPLWRSAADDSPIPAEQMDQWHEALAAMIRRLGVRRVLDIGCGTGELLLRIRDNVERYLGFEPAPSVVAGLRARFEGWAGVSFRAAYAHDLGNAGVRHAVADTMGPEGRPDCVVFNSVVQYFPSLDYLTSVLEDVCDLVGPGGHVIVGDVRSLPLVERFRQWREAVAGPTAAEGGVELCVDPLYFRSFVRQRPSTLCWLAPRMMSGSNELTDFRFDAHLHSPAGTVVAAAPYEVLDYARIGGSPADLRSSLEKAHAERRSVAVLGIPHARHRDAAASGEPMMPHALAQSLDGIPDARVGIDPLATQRGGLLVAYRPGGAHDWSELAAAVSGPDVLATSPQAGADRAEARRDISRFAADRLPGHMVPRHIHILAAMPLNASGKADRPALRALAERRGAAIAHCVDLPSVEASVESSLLDRAVKIVADLAGEPIGPDDDLLQAGVTSLKAAQIARALWRDLGRNISPGEVLRLATVRAIAATCDDGQHAAVPVPAQGPASPGAGLSLAQRSMLAWAIRRPRRRDLMFLLRWRISGPLRPAAVEQAVRALERRYPILMTRMSRSGEPIVGADEQPRVRVLEEPAANGPPADLVDCFDLLAEPPARWALRRLGADRAEIYAVLHHVAIDDGALVLLHRDLVAFYAGSEEDDGSRHIRHIEALRAEEALFRERAAVERVFWRKRAGRFADSLDLGDLAPGEERARRYSFPVPGGPAALQSSARRLGVTPYTLFLTLAGQVVAAAFSAAAVAVGVPVTSRELVGAEESMACFVNMVPLLVPAAGQPLDAAARQVSDELLAALDHSLLPFAEISTLVGLRRDAAGAAAVGLVCQLEEALVPACAGEVVFEPELSASLEAMYPLFVRGEFSADAFVVQVDTGRPELTEELAARIGADLVRAISCCASQPSADAGR